MQTPWSKEHKKDFAGAKYSLSNSFAEPLTWIELQRYYKNAVMKEVVAAADDNINNTDTDELLKEYYSTMNLQYTPNGGSLDLRTAITDLYNNEKTNNNNKNNNNTHQTTIFTPENVLVTAGGQVAIQLCAQAFLGCSINNKAQQQQQQRHAIVFTPGYQSNIESPMWMMGNNNSNVTVTKIQRRPNQQWQIDVDEVQRAIQPGITTYMVINEPHNPSGIVMTQDTQQALVELCRKHNIVLIADEVYRLLEHNSIDRIPAFCQIYEKAISIVTMSKPWGACGITIGWCICQNIDMIQQIWNCQYYGTACIARVCEIQAIMVLKSSSDILYDRLQIIQHNKSILQQIIEIDYPDLLSWQRPNAGAICFIKFIGPLTSKQFGHVLRRHNISIKPAYCFIGHQHSVDINKHNDDINDKDDNDDLTSYFRVGFGERKMLQALDAFVTVMETYKDEWRVTMKQQQVLLAWTSSANRCIDTVTVTIYYESDHHVSNMLKNYCNYMELLVASSYLTKILSRRHPIIKIYPFMSFRGSTTASSTTIDFWKWISSHATFLVMVSFMFLYIGDTTHAFQPKTTTTNVLPRTNNYFCRLIRPTVTHLCGAWSQQATMDPKTRQVCNTDPTTMTSSSDKKQETLASPRLWLEYQPNGVYTVIRCDLVISEEPISWSVWGFPFHLQRLQNSYRLLYPTVNNCDDADYDVPFHKAITNSIEIAGTLLANTFHQILHGPETLLTGNDTGCADTVVIMLTLLWYPNNNTTDPSTIEVMGHVYTSGIASNPKRNVISPIRVALALESLSTASQKYPTLPNRKDFHPKAKQSSWCSIRRPLEETFQRDGVKEILLVDQTGDQIQILEGLTSNCFFVYPGNIIKTPSSSSNILEGYARDRILKAARALGYSIEETCVTTKDSTLWQEVFLTSSIRICQPVNSIVVFDYDKDNSANCNETLLWEQCSRQEEEFLSDLPIWREIYNRILEEQNLC